MLKKLFVGIMASPSFAHNYFAQQHRLRGLEEINMLKHRQMFHVAFLIINL